jgi:hypothetical protein
MDVMGGDPRIEHIRPDELIRCKLYFDGYSSVFWTTRSNYEALIYHGFFVRDGSYEDSSGAVNTSSVYEETN